MTFGRLYNISRPFLHKLVFESLLDSISNPINIYNTLFIPNVRKPTVIKNRMFTINPWVLKNFIIILSQQVFVSIWTILFSGPKNNFKVLKFSGVAGDKMIVRMGFGDGSPQKQGTFLIKAAVILI